MPVLINDDPASRYIPRVSTPGPTNVPRWDTPDDPTVPDFTSFFEPGRWEEAKDAIKSPTSLQELGLSLTPVQGALALRDTVLRAPKANEWDTEYKPQPKYIPGRIVSAVKGLALGGAGAFGPAAYGWSGNTGVGGTRGKSPFGFQAPMWAALSAANAAMKAAGLGTFGITDGWRSYEQQVALKKEKPTLAATPGRSVHGLGLAADLKLTSAQFNWLKKNGARFGLVNLPSESWHWQYDSKLWGGF